MQQWGSRVLQLTPGAAEIKKYIYIKKKKDKHFSKCSDRKDSPGGKPSMCKVQRTQQKGSSWGRWWGWEWNCGWGGGVGKVGVRGWVSVFLPLDSKLLKGRDWAPENLPPRWGYPEGIEVSFISFVFWNSKGLHFLAYPVYSESRGPSLIYVSGLPSVWHRICFTYIFN